MILKRCYLTHNDCYWNPKYRSAIKGNPTGIVVHDTGAGNPWLKRYIQARSDNPNMAAINADLGKNTNNNHWNKSQSRGESNRWACVHAFIGKNAKGQIEVYETLPYNLCCWGVGDGSKGSFNYNPTARIQFEICDDGYQSEQYFNDCFNVAAEYCAYLCKKFNLAASSICNHKESYQMGYGGNHEDTNTWMRKFNKNMDWFRAKVQALLDKPESASQPTTKPEDKPMTIQEKQAFTALENKVKELSEQNKIYHTWNELPNWAKKPLRAMYDAGYFAGASPADLAINRTKLEVNVQMAKILKEKGQLNY